MESNHKINVSKKKYSTGCSWTFIYNPVTLNNKRFTLNNNRVTCQFFAITRLRRCTSMFHDKLVVFWAFVQTSKIVPLRRYVTWLNTDRNHCWFRKILKKSWPSKNKFLLKFPIIVITNYKKVFISHLWQQKSLTNASVAWAIVPPRHYSNVIIVVFLTERPFQRKLLVSRP